MDVEAVTDTAVALRFGKGELRGEMTGEEARRLVAGLLALRGLGAWRNIEVDMFTLSSSLLLLARPSRGERVYEFESFEDMLSAARAAAGLEDSSLTYCEGRWYLSFAGDEPPAFREYGAPVAEDGFFRAYLAEHGRVLIAGDAVTELRAMFGKST